MCSQYLQDKIHTAYSGANPLSNSNLLYHFNPSLFPHLILSPQLIRAAPLKISDTFLHLPLALCYFACTLSLWNLFPSVSPSPPLPRPPPPPPRYLSTTLGPVKERSLACTQEVVLKGPFTSGEEPTGRRALPRGHSRINTGGRKQFSTCK